MDMNNKTICKFEIKLRGDNVYDLYVNDKWVASRGHYENILNEFAQKSSALMMRFISRMLTNCKLYFYYIDKLENINKIVTRQNDWRDKINAKNVRFILWYKIDGKSF